MYIDSVSRQPVRNTPSIALQIVLNRGFRFRGSLERVLDVFYGVFRAAT